MRNTVHQSAPSTELALLGMLHHHPMHAYDLYSAISENQILAEIWHLKQSNVYALLNRMEEDGLLAGETEQLGHRPPRKVLHVTESGALRLRQWLEEPVPHGRDLRMEFLVKMYFARDFGNDHLPRLIDGQLKICEQWLASLSNEIASNDRTDPFYEIVLRFRLGQIEAIIAWLNLCKTTFPA